MGQRPRIPYKATVTVTQTYEFEFDAVDDEQAKKFALEMQGQEHPTREEIHEPVVVAL